MRKIYHLKTCSTNVKILKQLNLENVELVNIKEEGILAKDLDYAAKELGSFAELFSRKAMKYRTLKLNEKELSEEEMRKLILEEYTFLKRPLSIIDGAVFAGSTKASVGGLKEMLNE